MISKNVLPVLFVWCLLVFWIAVTLPGATASPLCDSCGHECINACGTRHFRTCCFNYLRKRNMPPPGLKLELWLEKSQMERAARNAALAGQDTEQHLQQIIQEQEHKKSQDLLEGGRLQLIYDEFP